MSHILAWIEAHPNTAGWVQAVGALVALVVAIAVPAFQSAGIRRLGRRTAAQQFSAVVMIVQRGAYLVGEAKRATEDPDHGQNYFTNKYDALRFEVISDALGKVEIHRLPTPGAVECFLDAKRYFEDCRGWITTAFNECGNKHAISDHVVEALAIAHDWLFANWSWLREERDLVEKGKLRFDLRIAKIGGKIIGHGRN